MEKVANQSRLDRIVRFIWEYTGSHPGYSPQHLEKELRQNFDLTESEARAVAELAVREQHKGELGLGAIELNLTFNCNLTCEYCFVHCKSPHERMSLETAQKAIDLLVDRAIFPNVVITLIGGEPLLEFPLIQQIVPYALERAARRNLIVTWAITTNGTLITEEMLQYFARHQMNLLISLDGGPETHDRYRRTRSGEGTWHKITGLLPLVQKYQPWLGARMTVSTEALSTMREDFNTLVGLGINQLIIAPAQGEQQWTLQEIEQYGKNMVGIKADYLEHKKKGAHLLIEELESGQPQYTGWGCRAGNTSLAIAPNGDLSPCSKLLGLTEEAGRYLVGNVHDAVDVQKLKPFRQAINQQPQRCKGCSRTCNGGCYAVNYQQTGDHFTPSEENCLFWVVGQELRK